MNLIGQNISFASRLFEGISGAVGIGFALNHLEAGGLRCHMLLRTPFAGLAGDRYIRRGAGGLHLRYLAIIFHDADRHTPIINHHSAQVQ